MGKITRVELLELLSEVFSREPDVQHGDSVQCFWCMASKGQHHEESCLWVRVAQVIEMGDLAGVMRVGEDTEDVLDGLEEDEDPSVDAVAKRVLDRVHREALTEAGPSPATLDMLRDVARAPEMCDDLLDELPTPTLIRDDVH